MLYPENFIFGDLEIRARGHSMSSKLPTVSIGVNCLQISKMHSLGDIRV